MSSLQSSLEALLQHTRAGLVGLGIAIVGHFIRDRVAFLDMMIPGLFSLLWALLPLVLCLVAWARCAAWLLRGPRLLGAIGLIISTYTGYVSIIIANTMH